jgi:hypothetical protein
MTRSRALSALLHCMLGLGLGVLIAAAALLTAAAIAGVFNTRPGTWTTRVTPFQYLPSLGVRVNVPGVVRLALSPIGQRILNGTARPTKAGLLQFRRHDRTLVVVCTPCRLDDTRLAPAPLLVSLELRLTRRDAADSNGQIEGALDVHGLHADFAATLTPASIDIAWTVPAVDAAAVLQVFAPVVPEAQFAQVAGTLAASGSLHLPGASVHSMLHIDGLQVSGLGTESLWDGLFEQPCTARDGSPRQILNGPGSRSWMPLAELGDRLPAAVLAAENQRFFEHPWRSFRQATPPPASARMRCVARARSASSWRARSIPAANAARYASCASCSMRSKWSAPWASRASSSST